MSELATDFTVCVLLYGDYPELAHRCLRSLVEFFPRGAQLRIGMNQCSDRTHEVVEKTIADGSPFVSIRQIVSATNIHKYPMMRRMFHDREQSVSTPYVMWFDDDSYLRSPGGLPWLAAVRERIQTAEMLGRICTAQQDGNQHLWVPDQPWFNGAPLKADHVFVFATGGWWVIRTEVLNRFDWPVPALDHCGGDVMLGELCRQHYLRLEGFWWGVAINADANGQSAAAPRRGFSQERIGWDYSPVPNAQGESPVSGQAGSP